MQVSNWVIIGTAEVFTLLMLLCIFLILHTSKLKKLVKGLQQKVQDLLTDLQQTKRAYAEMQDLLEEDGGSDYTSVLDEQLENTREYHQSLNPDRDISLDLAEDTPMPRQIASLRHAFLVTEKEASISGEDNNPNWLVIQSKLAAIIGLYQGSSAPDLQSIEKDADAIPELQNALQEKHQQIDELEGNLSDAQREAQEVHRGLQQIDVSSEDQQHFDNLLQRLKNAIALLGGDADLVTLTEQVTNTVELVRDGERSSEELMQLRALTADQHSMINKLQQRLKQAQTQEEKTLLINDLSEQLERQKRFVQEAETCIELMDNELNEANNTIGELQAKVEKLKQEGGTGRQNEMSDQIKSLKQAVKRLEDENEQLVMQLGM